MLSGRATPLFSYVDRQVVLANLNVCMFLMFGVARGALRRTVLVKPVSTLGQGLVRGVNRLAAAALASRRCLA